jgi:transcriptional regulator with XRE-family HTH domain
MLVIEFARRQKQLTQTQLSMATRIASHFISLLENSRAIPTEDQAQRLATALGVPADTLLQPVRDLVAAAEPITAERG